MPNKASYEVLNQGLVPVDKALDLMLEDAGPTKFEMKELDACHLRVLAKDVSALRTQPPFRASAMDGYAVRQADIETLPAKLKVIGESAAGHPFGVQLSKCEAVRIFTGAWVPETADTIIIQENTNLLDDIVSIQSGSPIGKFIREAGLDFKEGDVLLTKDQQLSPQNLSLAASMNHKALPVYSKPKVCLLATGDELVLPGEKLIEGQIISSNNFGVKAIVESAGASVIDLGISNDNKDEMLAKLQDQLGNGVDLIVTSGGASVGDHDLVKPVLSELGFTFSFEKIAMRPGKPVIFGKTEINGKIVRFLGLAGNPVSSLVSSHIFLKPLVQTLAGLPLSLAKPIQANLNEALSENDERQDYLRGKLEYTSNGEMLVTAFKRQDSSMLATFNKADCLIVRPVKAPPANKGDQVEVIKLR